MLCLLGAEYTMTATVLRPIGSPDTTTTGHWETGFDTISGAPKRKWVADLNSTTSGVQSLEVACAVKASGAETQKFTQIYENIGFARMTFSPSVHLSNRDQVTNIKNSAGEIIFRNEEAELYNPTTKTWVSKPTIFNVMGVTPITDPFGNITKNVALLQKAEVQA